MSFRQTLSGFRKKVKEKLSKIGDRLERRGADVGGDGLYRSPLSAQSEPGIVEGQFRGGDIKVSVGKDDPQPGGSQSISRRSMVGTGRDLGGSDDTAHGGKSGQKFLHPDPPVQGESGSSGERRDVDGERVDQPDPPSQSDIGNRTPTPSVSQGRESESA